MHIHADRQGQGQTEGHFKMKRGAIIIIFIILFYFIILLF